MTASGSMRIIVNGEHRTVPDGVTVRALLRTLEIESNRIAVEVNGRVVPARDHEAIALNERDRIEIVRFVGGG